MQTSTPLFIGIKGSVLAIDRASGNVLWTAPLKGGDFVNVVLDNGQLYAATRGELFCLDQSTGKILWHNRLTGMGSGLITFAQAAGGNVLTMEEKRRQDTQAAVTATLIASS